VKTKVEWKTYGYKEFVENIQKIEQGEGIEVARLEAARINQKRKTLFATAKEKLRDFPSNLWSEGLLLTSDRQINLFEHLVNENIEEIIPTELLNIENLMENHTEGERVRWLELLVKKQENKIDWKSLNPRRATKYIKELKDIQEKVEVENKDIRAWKNAKSGRKNAGIEEIKTEGLNKLIEEVEKYIQIKQESRQSVERS